MVSEGEIILCTVERIESTTVFVRLSSGELGTMVLSEIAPGRIKNLREYVVPNKKIVCKVIRVSGDHVDVSLRRVTSKERTELLEKYKQEQTAKSAINQLLKDKAKEVIEKIQKDFSLGEFINKAKEDEKIIEKYVPKEFQEAIKKITQKKQKEVEAKKVVKLSCLSPDGMTKIKKIMSTDQSLKVTYLAAAKFQISVKAVDYKIANQKINSFVEVIQKLSKQNSCEFEVLEE